MERIQIETDRLLLRRFVEKDMEALYLLLSDQEVNIFLPWYPVKDMHETRTFYETHFQEKKYCFAICLKGKDDPIGYVKVEEDDSYDLGYALRQEYWHQGIVSEASCAVMELLKKTGSRI